MSYEHISNEIVKCRKPHRCEWCGEQIEKNEKATYRAYKWDGDFHSDYMHAECVEGMRRSDKDDMTDYGFEPGMQLRGDVLASREYENSRQKSTPPTNRTKTDEMDTFEKWALDHYRPWEISEILLSKHDDGTYMTTNIRDALAGWQAATAASAERVKELEQRLKDNAADTLAALQKYADQLGEQRREIIRLKAANKVLLGIVEEYKPSIKMETTNDPL